MQKNSNKTQHQDNQEAAVRLDKWLWAARFFKTRSIARDNINAGKVHYNGAKAKPGKIVEPGALIKVPQGYDEKIITVLRVSEQRLSAPLAQRLYEETQLSAEKRAQNAAARKLNAFHSPRPDHRPDKKQRRDIIKLKHS
ncbi:ribosome-associated heat shock protein Hsp15 [Planctobacterium marinum]|uniref:ribosome-associated heat shock protein Hsp15 n=1 Tax=Planctobacterium marinum TaxID=1631968 RepID=UPI001E2C5C90|nr:ribosome-associated heat shock protein Hsp15 [Planctobacterium marinum]MCC2606498.1 ribosome-associated heat shock protein Hsp15 [Planctobacterium marinum]